MSIYFRYPCKTRRITDDFADHVKRGSHLPGIDFACPIGEKFWATANGRVVTVDRNPNQEMGRHVVVRHRGGYESYYLHLDSINVSVGQRVIGGKVLGRTGNSSAGNSTGPHLHFTIKFRGKCVNPLPILRKSWIDYITALRQKKKAAKI